MTSENLKKTVVLAKAVHALRKETGVYSLDPDRNGPRVHMDHEDFLATFSDYDTEDRGSDDYPYKFETTVDGVRFFALLSQEEYDEMVR